jgi:hypothetical protein
VVSGVVDCSLQRIAVLGLVSVSTALAHRPATRSEKAALTRAFNRSAHEHVPERCLDAVVSTANTTWAEVYFKGLMPHGCERYAANGVSILPLPCWESSGLISGCSRRRVSNRIRVDWRSEGVMTVSIRRAGVWRR